MDRLRKNTCNKFHHNHFHVSSKGGPDATCHFILITNLTSTEKSVNSSGILLNHTAEVFDLFVCAKFLVKVVLNQ